MKEMKTNVKKYLPNPKYFPIFLLLGLGFLIFMALEYPAITYGTWAIVVLLFALYVIIDAIKDGIDAYRDWYNE